MRARRLSLSVKALSDLAEIRAYLKEMASDPVAGRVVRRIRERIRRAREIPHSGAPRPEVFENCRFVMEGVYAIYYEYDGDLMRVVRIVHQARNSQNLTGS